MTDPLQLTSTTTNKPWLRKMMIFLLLALVLFGWGLYDASYLYPKRGKEDAEFKLKEYLVQAESAGRISSASVEDPVSAFEQLDGKPVTSDLDRAKLNWLTALSRVGQLTPAFTDIKDPRGTLNQLRAVWEKRDKPKALDFYDIPLQWFITAVGLVATVGVLINIVRSKGRIYRWEPEQQRLTLPDGRTIVPGDLVELDKRKWHKFFVTLVLKSGQNVELDLYKHYPLEEWVLAMENTAFPPPPEAAEPAPETQDAPAT
jgi:hypothetical protein